MYELYLPPERLNRSPITGRFLKGATPHNKGKKWKDYIDGRKARKMKKCLELGRKQGNPAIAGWNSKKVIGIVDNKIIGVYSSSNEAGRKLNIQSRNIRSCCAGERKRAGGILWFWEEDYTTWEKELNHGI